MSVVADRAIVKKELLSQVAGTDGYRVNNKYDDKYPPLPVTKVIKQALKLEGKELPYSLTSKNCEHFVTQLRYGVPICEQVRVQPVSASLEPGHLLSCQWLGTHCDWTRMVTGTQTRQNIRDRIPATFEVGTSVEKHLGKKAMHITDVTAREVRPGSDSHSCC